MADFEIIEADFQQYYNLDVSTLKFRRYARLLVNLPMQSRFVQKYLESKDWDWDKEVHSRILMMLDLISCQLSNMFKKKGTKPRKPAEQFQPDYVKKAKASVVRGKAEENAAINEDLKEIFEQKNNKVNKLGAQDENILE